VAKAKSAKAMANEEKLAQKKWHNERKYENGK